MVIGVQSMSMGREYEEGYEDGGGGHEEGEYDDGGRKGGKGRW
jgi:hypothetical protein